MNHQLSPIHPDARIAEGVIIDPFVYVAADV